jgi:hypothetical protein
MKNYLSIFGILAILSVSCLNTEKDNNAKEKKQDSVVEQCDLFETYFQTGLVGMHSKDSIVVRRCLYKRDLLIIYSHKTS